jgi:hypothetical protein
MLVAWLIRSCSSDPDDEWTAFHPLRDDYMRCSKPSLSLRARVL